MSGQCRRQSAVPRLGYTHLPGMVGLYWEVIIVTFRQCR
jgi:hypothetical protein